MGKGTRSPKRTPPAMEQSEKAKRMNLAAWRASRIHELELPSGLLVKVRDVTLTDLMMTGKLPDVIMDLAKEAADGGAVELDLNMIVKNTTEFGQMLDTMMRLCLVEPKIGDAPDDEHILLGELPHDDKMTVFAFVNREAEQMRSFPGGADKPVEAVQPGSSLQVQAE